MTAQGVPRAKLLCAIAAALAIASAVPAEARHEHGGPGHAGGPHHGGAAFRGHGGSHMATLGRHEGRHAREHRHDVVGWRRHNRRESGASAELWRSGRGRSELVREVSFESRSERFDGWDWRAWGWGWHAGPWPWGAWVWPSLAIGVSFGVIAAPPVIVPPPLFYAAPPPIIAALPAIAPPSVVLPPSPVRRPAHTKAAAAPPSRAPPPLSPPTAGALLGAAMPPPIVVLPPPFVIAAAAPPPLILARPELALVIDPPVLAFARIEPAFGWHRGVAGFRDMAFIGFGQRRTGFGEVRSRLRDRHGRSRWAWGGMRHGTWTGPALGGWREARRATEPAVRRGGRH